MRGSSGLPESRRQATVEWPVFAWRAVATRRSDDDLDALQRAVLVSAQAGIPEPSQLAPLLGVSEELLGLVIQGLLSGRLLEKKGLSEKGRDVLKGLEPSGLDEHRERGWVLRCGVTGDVMPFFLPGSLPGPSRNEPSLTVGHNEQYRSKPGPGALEDAFRAARKGQRLAKEGFQNEDPDEEELGWEDETEDDEGPDATVVRVRIVGPVPDRTTVEVPLFALPDDPTRWLVGLPRWAGPRSWYQRALRQGFSNSGPLKAWRNERMAQALTQGAPLDLRTIEGIVVREHPILTSNPALAPVRPRLVRARNAERMAATQDDVHDTIIIRYAQALETLLRVCVLGCDRRDEAVDAGSQSDWTARLRALGASLGFDIPGDAANYRVQPKDLRRVASTGGTEIRKPVAFLLCHVYVERGSSFANALRADPRLLAHISELAKLRNEFAAHASTSGELATATESARAAQLFQTILVALGPRI